jgi:hypothetical protein
MSEDDTWTCPGDIWMDTASSFLQNIMGGDRRSPLGDEVHPYVHIRCWFG